MFRASLPQSIKFIRPWRGREVGSIDSQLNYGVMVELVRRKFAEFSQPERKRKAGA